MKVFHDKGHELLRILLLSSSKLRVGATLFAYVLRIILPSVSLAVQYKS